jgi:hypothetical protein
MLLEGAARKLGKQDNLSILQSVIKVALICITVYC